MGKCVNGLMREKQWKIDKVIEHRRKIANLYKKALLGLGIEPPYEPEYAEHTYLKFPLLVKDRAKFFRLAEKETIELGDWFVSPIHPIQKNFELWHYKYGEFLFLHFVGGKIQYQSAFFPLRRWKELIGEVGVRSSHLTLNWSI